MNQVQLKVNLICFWSGLLILVVLTLNGCMPLAQPKPDPLDILFPHRRIGDINSVDFDEPSGIVFHARRGTLFVVDDDGDLAEIQRDGSPVRTGEIEDADFEGITYNPATGLLYAVIEKDAKIIEINPDDFGIGREITIEPVFNEKRILHPGENSVEGLTFAPNSDHPEGGTFFITSSSKEEQGNETAASMIIEVEAPLQNLAGKNSTARIINVFPLNVVDLSGLHYDSESGHLYVISDTTNTFFEMTREGEVLKSYAFPGKNQEGITVDDEGFLYFVQDSGSIIKVKWLKEDSQ